MKKRLQNKDAGTIFMPAMYLAILILVIQLLLLFLGYKQIAWVSGTVTDSMTDALLGACTLNEEELYHYGRSDELVILNPREKYDTFGEILKEELGLDEYMKTTSDSIPFITGTIRIQDFVAYSVSGRDVTIYDFEESGSYTTSIVTDGAGSMKLSNGEVIEHTSLLAEIDFTIDFLGFPVEVSKYHMVDVKR